MLRTGALCLLLCLSDQLHAADSDGNKIGLVLSGGAARGLSHIGVITALEQQGIQVDAITGTSMGAIVGGMYASGYSVAQMEQVATQLDWGYAMADHAPRADLTFRRKEDDRRNLLKTKLTIAGDEVLLPYGVLDGQNLGLVLQELFQHSNAVTQFDQLPIPFRAVATDLATGEPVVLSSGSLPTAIRASMSIPALLAPVTLDGQLLADGGMANNMPVDVARAMGVDRVIAVNIGAPLERAHALKSVFKVTEQVTTFLTIKGTEIQKAGLTDKDLLLEPALGDIGSIDFEAAPEAIELGYNATMAKAAQLASFRAADPQATPDLVRDPTPVISAISIQNNSYLHDDAILSFIRQPKGEAFDKALLIHNINTLYGLDYFVRVNYELLPTANNSKRLHLIVNGDARHLSFVRFGFSTSDDLRGNNYYNLAASFNKVGITQYGAEWYTQLQIGYDTLFSTEFFLPLGYERPLYLKPVLSYQAHDVPLYSLDFESELLILRDRKTSGGLVGGYMFSQFTDLSLGLHFAEGHMKVKAGVSPIDSFDYRQGYAEAAFRLDSEDNVYFPSHGSRVELSYRHFDEQLGADADYEETDALVSIARSVGKNTLILRAQAARADNSQVIPSFGTQLGGLGRLSGLSEGSLVTHNNELISLRYNRLLNKPLLVFNTRYYFMASLEYGRAWNNGDGQLPFDSGYITAASVGVAMDSPFGPVVLAYGRNDADQQSVYFYIGRSL